MHAVPILLLGLWGLSEDSVLPPAADAERLCEAARRASPNDAWVHQPERCAEHLVRLRHLRTVHGWSNGIWDAAISETEFRQGCWEVLEASQQATGDFGDWHCRRMLGRYKGLVGAARFKAGWTPAPIPEAGKFRPLYPRPPLRDRGTGANSE